MVPVAQTLHGYEQGHRLLASGGDVDDAELALLDRLSDLSGYVPVGTEFEHYHTGFVCGRYYAFACTWPDRDAIRAGTVLTHTLLVPHEVVCRFQDLWDLAALHRRPLSAHDREPYRDCLRYEPIASPPASLWALPEERALAAIVLWFGQETRPVLWVEQAPPVDIVRYLWSLLWPEARERFSFCTFALQVRQLRGHPFGFLALPAAARGSFHERTRSEAWFRDGRITSTRLAARMQQGWARAIVEHGPRAMGSMPAFCAEHSLPMLDESDIPIFYRFVDLEIAAKERVTASRARVDLLFRLWPDLAPTHPLVSLTLRQLLSRQGDAPLQPRPFWELSEFLKRPQVLVLARSDEAFAIDLQRVVTSEVQRRILEAGSESISGIAALPFAIFDGPIGDAAIHGVTMALDSIRDDAALMSKAIALLFASAEASSSALAVAVVRALPKSRRSEMLCRALRAVENEDPRHALLRDSLLQAADRLSDWLLIADVWIAEGQPTRALESIVKFELSKPSSDWRHLENVLAKLDAETRWAWALSVSEPKLAEWAAQQGARARKELGLNWSTTVAQCRDVANRNWILVACLDDASRMATVGDDLLNADVALAMHSLPENAPNTHRVAMSFVPQLVRFFARRQRSAELSSLWFGLSAIRSAIEQMDAKKLWGSDSVLWTEDCLPNISRAIAFAAQEHPPKSVRWVSNLLEHPLEIASLLSLSRSVDPIAQILAVPVDRDGYVALAARVLAAAKRTNSRGALPLVEFAFPVLYPRAIRDELDPASKKHLDWVGWDVAKTLRHWLLDAFLEHQWPPASFLRCLGNDVALFRRIAYRAFHKKGKNGPEFIRSLPKALSAAPSLAVFWRRPVERFLADPDAPL